MICYHAVHFKVILQSNTTGRPNSSAIRKQVPLPYSHSQAIDFLADDPLGLIPRKTSRTVEMTKKIEVLPDKTGFHRIILLKFKMALVVKLTPARSA